MAISARIVITPEMIYSQIDSLQIFQRYCQRFTKPDFKFNSELRTDPNASCSISWLNGDYLYHDFGNGESLRAINYVMSKYNLDFYNAMVRIQQDFSLNLIPIMSSFVSSDRVSSGYSIGQVQNHKRDASLIQIKKRDFNKLDKLYWYDRYSIGSKTLKMFNVVPIQEYWLGTVSYYAEPTAYSYEFYWEDGIFRRKLYQPFLPVDRGKWYSNGGLVVQGEGCLPYSGDLLVITKSLKDVMELSELGYVAIAPTSESSWLPESYFFKQATRFKRMVLLFDNDTTGKLKSIQFGEKYKISSIMIPNELTGCKDISDVVLNHGVDFAKNLMSELL